MPKSPIPAAGEAMPAAETKEEMIAEVHAIFTRLSPEARYAVLAKARRLADREDHHDRA